MTSYSGGHLFDLLGASIVDDRVAALLTRLGAPMPVGRAARETDVRAREQGLDLRFKPVGSLREGIVPGASPDEVLLSVVFFHGPGHENYPEFSGELPFGLRFDMSRAEVEAILDPLTGRNDRCANRWDFDPQYLTIDFRPDGAGIKLVTAGLPWRVPAPRRPTRTEIATDDLIRRLTTQPVWSLRDHSAGPATAAPNDVPDELAALRREQARQETPFFADGSLFGDHAITLSDAPVLVGELLGGAEGPAYARFFEDVLWIGQDREGNLLGYWRAGADTFREAPVISIDSEASFVIAAPRLVDHLAELVGPDAPVLVDFCRRAGLPMPRNKDESFQATYGLPDPERIRGALQNLERA